MKVKINFDRLVSKALTQRINKTDILQCTVLKHKVLKEHKFETSYNLNLLTGGNYSSIVRYSVKQLMYVFSPLALTSV